MALTIKKRKNNNLNVPNFDLSEMINSSIKALIVGKLQLRRESLIKYIEYFPTFKVCKHTQDKTLSSMYLRIRYHSVFTPIGAREIELSGATITEFVEFLSEKGAKEVCIPKNILESI